MSYLTRVLPSVFRLVVTVLGWTQQSPKQTTDDQPSVGQTLASAVLRWTELLASITHAPSREPYRRLRGLGLLTCTMLTLVVVLVAMIELPWTLLIT